MFAAVYRDADSEHALTGASTHATATGQGVIFDTILLEPGKYPIVDHSMRVMTIGAAGALQITPLSFQGPRCEHSSRAKLLAYANQDTLGGIVLNRDLTRVKRCEDQDHTL